MSPTHRVPGEIDATCNRCEMVLAHIIMSMVGPRVARVKCNTCGSEHSYKGTSPVAVPKAARAASERPTKTIISFDDELKSKRISQAQDYSPKITFAVDDVVDHPSFGMGWVKSVRGDKMEVIFKTAERLLVHGKK